MNTKIKKTWATVLFSVTVNDTTEEVELTLNYEDKTFNLCTKGEENVKITEEDGYDGARAKIFAQMKAISYVTTEFSNYDK